MPILCLLDALADSGWTGVDRIVQHSEEAASDKVFDKRKPLSKRCYLRCMLVLDSLFSRGLMTFKSGRPDTYYRYVLQFARLPPADMNMATANELVKEAQGSEDPDHGYPVVLAPPLPLVGPVDPDIVASDDEPQPVPGPEPEPVLDIVDDPPPLPAEPAPAVLADGVIPDDVVPIPAADDWPTTWHGKPLRVIAGRRSAERVCFFSRLEIDCPNRLHVECRKSRSTELLKDPLGHRAPLCFLGVWAEHANRLTGEEHRKFVPTLEQQRDYRLRHFFEHDHA